LGRLGNFLQVSQLIPQFL